MRIIVLSSQLAGLQYINAERINFFEHSHNGGSFIHFGPEKDGIEVEESPSFILKALHKRSLIQEEATNEA